MRGMSHVAAPVRLLFLGVLGLLGACLSNRGLAPAPSPAPGARQGGAGGAAGGPGMSAGSGGSAGTSAAPGGDAGGRADPKDAREAADANAAADVRADATMPPIGGPDAPAPTTSLTSCEAILTAASGFLDGLEPAKKNIASKPFEARKHYRFTPEPTRPGLSLANMTEAQRTKALALLRASLSDTGFERAMHIRTLDDWLKANVGGLPFGSLNYYVSVFGVPSREGNWAWHWEGHHASLHFTFTGCRRAASTPFMLGAEPARLETAFAGLPAGTRVLGKQEDLARDLATMLAADPAKKAQAIAASGGRMLPNTPAKQSPVSPPGLSVAKMSAPEIEKVKQLLSEVAGNVNPELAALRLAKVNDAGVDKLTFLWVGSLSAETNAIYYFRLQGPTFIFEHNIEWENHIHSAWRDFDGDFGEDLLQLHLKSYPHRSASLYGPAQGDVDLGR
jgi:Protein of unknown function (DUF3500)